LRLPFFPLRSSPVRARRNPRLPEGLVVCAFGDVHGRADLLEPLLQALVEDAVSESQVIVIGLGDYVDRGPESRRVIELLLRLAEKPGVTLRCLRGNHDQALVDFVADHESGPAWSRHGGAATLRSYGVEPPEADAAPQAWRAVHRAFVDGLPGAHLAFFDRLALSLTVGDYFFAHAGANPVLPLDRQVGRDLLWIRDPFLTHERRLEKIVVHGHTPSEAVHVDHRRIGLDTGAHVTGVLSACRLQGEDQQLIQALATRGGRPEIRRGAL